MAEHKIDCEPKWVNLIPLFFDWLENGKEYQRLLAKEEIEKMAKTCDIIRQAQKQKKDIIFRHNGRVEELKDV